MAANGRALRLLKAMDILATKTSFDYGAVLSKVKMLSAANGTLQATFTVDKTMCNMAETLHGGYIASVTDVLSYYTQLSNTDGRISWTTSLNINFIGQAADGEKINVLTKTVTSGHSSLVETYFRNEKGNLLAKGTTSFLKGSEKYQKIGADIFNFNVYEN